MELDATEERASLVARPDPGPSFVVPTIVADTSDDAGERFLEFFAATIRNANTRGAYMRAVEHFLGWRGVADLASLGDIRPLHIAAYIEECQGLFYGAFSTGWYEPV